MNVQEIRNLNTPYIAGPYTSTTDNRDIKDNVERAISIGEKIRHYGYLPFVPHLFDLWEDYFDHDYDYWMQMDYEWLEKCDCLIRFKGESSGADQEVVDASKLGMPSFLGPLEFLETKASTCFIFAIYGARASGKSTFEELVDDKFENLEKVVSATTRNPRSKEKEGEDYHFLSEEEFRNSNLIESTKIGGHYYGITEDSLNDILFRQKDAVVVLDENGINSLADIYGSQVVPIKVSTDRDIRLKRLTYCREDTGDQDAGVHQVPPDSFGVCWSREFSGNNIMNQWVKLSNYISNIQARRKKLILGKHVL